MTNAIVFPGHEALAVSMGLISIPWTWRHFPDGESYVRIDQCHCDTCYILCSLNSPDTKLFPLIMVAQTLKTRGIKTITLIAPYLGYMRQDKEFAPGEAVSSKIVGQLLSQYVDHIMTVDPHLHRLKSLDEIFSIKNTVLHAGELLAQYIQEHVTNPLLIGPDAESQQWVERIAGVCNAPYVVASKIRQGDKDVTVTMPDLAEYVGCNPVLVDDVIASGRTLYEAAIAINHPNLTIMAVHGIFSDDAYALLQTVSLSIVTTNTIPHETNKIDIGGLLKL